MKNIDARDSVEKIALLIVLTLSTQQIHATEGNADFKKVAYDLLVKIYHQETGVNLKRHITDRIFVGVALTTLSYTLNKQQDIATKFGVTYLTFASLWIYFKLTALHD